MFYNNKKKKAIAKVEYAETQYKALGSVADSNSISLYNLRKKCSKEINNVEAYINKLSNTPKNYLKDITKVKITIKEFNYAISIESQYQKESLKNGSMAGAGILGGSAIASLGPTAAMTIATTFGTASTGTAIASLSGAAATNSALAWLGGGALSVGGGGMAAGQWFLTMFGPVGWGIAGTLAVGGGFLAIRNNKKTIEKAEKAYLTIMPIIADLERKLQELKNLYTETEKLLPAIQVDKVCRKFPNNYVDFTDTQKKELGALINSTKIMGELINKRIK